MGNLFFLFDANLAPNDNKFSPHLPERGPLLSSRRAA